MHLSWRGYMETRPTRFCAEVEIVSDDPLDGTLLETRPCRSEEELLIEVETMTNDVNTTEPKTWNLVMHRELGKPDFTQVRQIVRQAKKKPHPRR